MISRGVDGFILVLLFVSPYCGLNSVCINDCYSSENIIVLKKWHHAIPTSDLVQMRHNSIWLKSVVFKADTADP